MKKIKNSTVKIVGEDDLFSNVSRLIDESRKQVVKALNTAMVYTYYGIGKYIVEFEQGGNKRAEYGKGVLKRLSERLTERFGNGWSTDSLEKARTLFIVYSKSATVSRKSGDGTKNENSIPQFTLSWSHYLTLMRIENPQARDFYEIEACKQQWSVRYLQRQVGSCLYERLALNRNKDDVLRLSLEGQTLEKPSDVIKDPLVLDFIGLKPDNSYNESDVPLLTNYRSF